MSDHAAPLIASSPAWYCGVDPQVQLFGVTDDTSTIAGELLEAAVDGDIMAGPQRMTAASGIASKILR
jgi:hypothetical protein